MALDVEVPNPPDLTNRGVPAGFEGDVDELASPAVFHRAELEQVLRDGAWQEAFREWTAYTDLSEVEYRTLRDHGCFEALDLYWDPSAERLRADVPSIPTDVDDEVTRSLFRTELSDLCDVVVEMIEDAYWEGEPRWTDDIFEEEPTGEPAFEEESRPEPTFEEGQGNESEFE